MDTWTISDLGTLKWNRNAFDDCYVATSPYGGYIACVPKDENEERSLYIYDSCGTLLVEDRLSMSYHVIGAYWTNDLRLCIFLDDCRVVIYTANTDPRHLLELLSEEEIESGIRMRAACLFGATACLVSTKNDIYFVSEIGLSLAKMAPSLPQDVKDSSFFILGMLPDTCLSSRNTSVIISVSSGPFAGVLFVVNNSSNYTHMLLDPEEDALRFMSLHPYHALTAYCSNHRLVVCDNDCKYTLFKCKLNDKVASSTPSPRNEEESDSPSPQNEEESDSPSPQNEEESTAISKRTIPHSVYGLYWLSDSCVVVLMSHPEEESIIRAVAINIHGGFDWLEIREKASSMVYQQEIDGLRVITPSRIMLIRQNLSLALHIPSHMRIYQQFSFYNEYFVAKYRSAQEGEEERTDYSDIEESLRVEVIKEIMKYCEWDNGTSNALLLQALRYAIQFISSLSVRQELYNCISFTCSTIRVLFNLKDNGVLITKQQYTSLSFPSLLSRLISQNKHLVALSICDVFNYHSNRHYHEEESNYFDRFRGIIAMDWATKKIQTSDLPSDQLASIVFQNIMKIGKVPVIPIILNVYDSRPDLAVNLLLLESDVKLAIACLLKIGEYNEALNRAIETHDPELVFAVVAYTGTHMDDRDSWFSLISSDKESESVFLNYYSDMEYYELVLEYKTFTNRIKECMYQVLHMAIYNCSSLETGEENDYDDMEKTQIKMNDLQRCNDYYLPGENDFDVNCIKNQISLFVIQCKLSSTILNYSLYNTIINLLARRRDDSNNHALYLKQQYLITDVRYDILQLFALGKGGYWEDIRVLYNKRKSIIPIECFLYVVLSKKAYNEGDHYLSIMNIKESPALALHYALLLNQWTLATRLAVELNDYSSILIIMDNVDNDVPGIRMELFNYIRNSGYERESVFVNDVKSHPVLKLRKSFASGILAAFSSNDGSKSNLDDEDGDMVVDSVKSPSSGLFSSFRKTMSPRP